jgi:hypothetical protein
MTANKKIYQSECPGGLIMEITDIYSDKFSTEQRRSIRGQTKSAIIQNKNETLLSLLRAVERILARQLNVNIDYQCPFYIATIKEIKKNGDFEPIRSRKNDAISKNKLNNALFLFEKYIDETAETIKIISPTIYLINDFWEVNIATNKIRKIYPDID